MGKNNIQPVREEIQAASEDIQPVSEEIQAAFEYHKCSELYQTSDKEIFLSHNDAKNWAFDSKLEDKTILTLKNS